MEIMITIAMAGLVIGLVSSNTGGLMRLVQSFNQQAAFNEQYTLFLLIFESDYQQAELTASSGITAIDNLSFQRDHNRDGDYDDAGERIAYRWNNAGKRIDRKSGNGNFQAYLEGVSRFSWDKISTTPLCHRFTLQTVFSPVERKIEYCRLLF